MHLMCFRRGGRELHDEPQTLIPLPNLFCDQIKPETRRPEIRTRFIQNRCREETASEVRMEMGFYGS